MHYSLSYHARGAAYDAASHVHYSYHPREQDPVGVTRYYGSPEVPPRFSTGTIKADLITQGNFLHLWRDDEALLYVKRLPAPFQANYGVFAARDIFQGKLLTQYFGVYSKGPPKEPTERTVALRNGYVDAEPEKEYAIAHLMNSAQHETIYSATAASANAMLGSHGEVMATTDIARDTQILLDYQYNTLINRIVYEPDAVHDEGQYNDTMMFKGKRAELTQSMVTGAFKASGVPRLQDDKWTELRQISVEVGKGLFAARRFYRGDFIAEFMGGMYVGLGAGKDNLNESYCMEIRGSNVYIDPTRMGPRGTATFTSPQYYAHQGAHYINSVPTDKANVKFIQDDGDEPGRPFQTRVLVVVTKTIEAGEQILANYTVHLPKSKIVDYGGAQRLPALADDAQALVEARPLTTLIGTYYGYTVPVKRPPPLELSGSTEQQQLENYWRTSPLGSRGDALARTPSPHGGGAAAAAAIHGASRGSVSPSPDSGGGGAAMSGGGGYSTASTVYDTSSPGDASHDTPSQAWVPWRDGERREYGPYEPTPSEQAAWAAAVGGGAGAATPEPAEPLELCAAFQKIKF